MRSWQVSASPPQGVSQVWQAVRGSARTHWKRMRAVLDELGLEGIVPHDGRHIVATDIILNEGTLADVSVALHHKSLLSSARYVHLLTQHAERVLNGIGKRR